MPPDPAPREVLLDLLAAGDDRLAPIESLLTDGHSVQVLTTGPGVAVALVRDRAGVLVATVQAHVGGGSVTSLDVLR